jgi:hypothetical protein
VLAPEQLVESALIVGGVAGLLALAAWLWIVVLAFSEDIFAGILCLLGGIYALYFGVTRWQECKIPFVALCLFGLLSSSALGYNVAHSDYTKEITWVRDQIRQRINRPTATLTSAQMEELLAEDQDRLQGRWVVSSSRRSESLTIDGDQCRFGRVDGEDVLQFELVLLEGNRGIDLSAGDGSEVTKGIYLLERDRAKICLGVPGGARPTQFTGIDKQQQLFVLRRPWN